MNSVSEISLKNELESFGRVYSDVPLCAYTTFKTGGRADILFEPHGETELCRALPVIKGSGALRTIIGGGSNLLVSDSGLRGIVVRIAGDARPVISEGQIYASASVSKESFIDFALENSFGGIEFMAGIPGNIGGGIFMNAGTNMGSFSDILESVKVAHMDGTVELVKIDSSIHDYRRMDLPQESVILGGYFRLPAADDIYAVKKRVEDIIAERKMKHPMDFPSAGSVFKNPRGHSSWKLINDAGLKGYSIGGARISEKHTNFIINAGGALSDEIYRLIKHVQAAVYAATGIMLETEVRMLGKFD